MVTVHNGRILEQESGNDGIPRVRGDSVSSRNVPSGSAVNDGRTSALAKTTALSKGPRKERTPGVSWGFFHP
jgi:hypothetical protein